MAVLDETSRADLFARFMQTSSGDREGLPLTKAELRAAVNATDDWIDANAASYNNAIPAAARSALTAKQKARLLTAVANRRFEVT
jgi:hypothetical protein